MAVTWRQRLARRAVRGAAVLVVETPGGWAVRVAVQRALAARGWREASSPADADGLLVCGVPGAGWDEVLGRTWAQLPGPRARGSLGPVDDVDGALDALAARLLDDEAQRADAAGRDREPDDLTPGDDMNPGGMELAGGEDDLRDGLEMDVLRIPLGPVLPCWPAGLVLRTVLSGDVVVRAEVEVLPGGARGPVDDVARRLDAAAQVLALAGAVDLAAAAVRVRDAALDVPPPRTSTTTRHEEPPSPALRRLRAGKGTASTSRTSTTTRHEERPSTALRRLPAGEGVGSPHFDDNLLERAAGLRGRVERSRVLRWSLPDDVRALLLGLLDPDAHDDDPGRRTREALDALPERLVGTELVTARLLVAALDLRTDALDPGHLAALVPQGVVEDGPADDKEDSRG